MRALKDLFDFNYDDFQLKDYNPHPHIAGAIRPMWLIPLPHPTQVTIT